MIVKSMTSIRTISASPRAEPCGTPTVRSLTDDFCPRRDFAQKAKSRGATLVNRAYGKVLTAEIDCHTANIEKISISLNRSREESVGNDGVFIVCARKCEMVRMT